MSPDIYRNDKYHYIKILKRFNKKLFQKMYPRRIESFESIERVDETGLTGPQKIALQNGWRIIKTQATYHATNIFLALVFNF